MTRQRSEPQEVPSSLGTEISTVRALQVPTPSGLADTWPLSSRQENGCRTGSAILLRHFVSFSQLRQRRSSPHTARGAACRWGSGNAHRHLPVSRVLGTATALATQGPLPGRHFCHFSQPGDTVPSGWQRRAHGPTAAGCPLPEQPVLLCCGNVTRATFSSSSPMPALKKKVFVSRGFAFNSQRNKIYFKTIKKAPRKPCVMEDASLHLFPVKGKEKTAKLMLSFRALLHSTRSSGDSKCCSQKLFTSMLGTGDMLNSKTTLFCSSPAVV